MQLQKKYKNIFEFWLKLLVDILGRLHLSSLKGDESSQYALIEQKKSDWGQKFFLCKQFRPTYNFQFKNSARNLLQGTVTKNQQSLKLNQTKRLQPNVKEKVTGGESFFFRSNLDQQPFGETFTKELKSFDQNLKKW